MGFALLADTGTVTVGWDAIVSIAVPVGGALGFIGRAAVNGFFSYLKEKDEIHREAAAQLTTNTQVQLAKLTADMLQLGKEFRDEVAETRGEHRDTIQALIQLHKDTAQVLGQMAGSLGKVDGSVRALADRIGALDAPGAPVKGWLTRPEKPPNGPNRGEYRGPGADR